MAERRAQCLVVAAGNQSLGVAAGSSQGEALAAEDPGLGNNMDLDDMDGVAVVLVGVPDVVDTHRGPVSHRGPHEVEVAHNMHL